MRLGEEMKKVAVIAVAVLAALVISVATGSAKTSDASHCQYGKLFRGWQGVQGTIYLRLTITPRNPIACRTWDAKYFKGGLLFRKKLGTGVRLCQLLDKTSGQTVTVAVFADKANSGRVFCRKFHPSWPRR
jgi:hypothetical protein